MRKTLLAVATVFLFLPPAGAQQAERLAPAGNLLTRYLDRANIHPAVALGRLTVFPISLSREHRLSGVLTMEQALAKRLLAIQELDPPEVERARFVNRSGKEMIFLMAGELITGGKQNRTLATDALLGPDSATVLPLYCIQKGRWEGAKDFGAKTFVAPQSVRAKAAQGAGQREVWAEVARSNRQLGSATTSEDLAAAMEKPENVKRFTELRRRVAPKLPESCVGLVLARDGAIVAADLFNSAELFSAMREKVLDAYLSQYEAGIVEGHPGERPEQTEVREYLQGCYRARFQPGPMRGVGRMYEISGARTGQTLGYGPQVIPLRESRERPEVALGEYMVHTALMSELVPVRPVEPPTPRPLPQRER